MSANGYILRATSLASPGASASFPLFLAFGFYLATPLGDVPLLGISLSAPVFALIAVELLRRCGAAWLDQGVWTLLAACILAAHFLSLAANVIFGRLGAIGAAELSLVIHTAYWMLVFLATIWVVSRVPIGRNLAIASAAGVVALGLTRVAEALTLATWGAGQSALMTQNSYGWGFSTFSSFIVWYLLDSKGVNRILSAAAMVLVLVAAAGNGSRTSWVTTGLSVVLTSFLCLMARPQVQSPAVAAIVVSVAVAAGVFYLGPRSISGPVVDRSATFASLERDKPLLARELMVQKAFSLFKVSPLWGVGAGRFIKEQVELDIPEPLRWRTQAYYHTKTPHNAYAKVLAETGLAGALPLAGLLLLLLSRGLPAAIRLARGGETWAAPMLVAFLMMCVHSWTLSGLTGTCAWFVFGMLAGVVELDRRQRARPIRGAY